MKSAARATFAQGFEVVLQTRHRVSKCVELATAWNALATQQFDADVLTHATEIIGRRLQVEHAQRTSHFIEQVRHALQTGMVPVGFDEGDKRFARCGKVGDGFVRQHFDRAPGFH